MLVYAVTLAGDDTFFDEVKLKRLLSRYGEPRVITLGRTSMGIVGYGDNMVCKVRESGECVDLIDGMFADVDEVDLHHALKNEIMPLGHYALLHISHDTLLCARDHLGCRPLFIGQLNNTIAVSNIPNIINMLGAEPEPVQPASITKINQHGVSTLPYWKPTFRKEDDTSLVELLRDTLLDSVRRIVKRRSGLFFSGGLDSNVLAKLCIDSGLEPVFISSGLKEARDWRNIRAAADSLGVEVMEVEITEEDIENAVRELEHVLGTLSVMDAAIGCVFAIQSKRLHEAGIRYAVAGQGADELFGGYMKYLRILEEHGYLGLQKSLTEDVFNLHRFGLPRDSLACKLADVELTLPYLLPTVAEIGLAIPPELKLRRREDGIVVRKYILRLVAEQLGLGEIAYVEKSALQYGTGVNKAVERMMRRWRITS